MVATMSLPLADPPTHTGLRYNRGTMSAARFATLAAFLTAAAVVYPPAGARPDPAPACPEPGDPPAFFCRRAVIPAPNVDFARMADLDPTSADNAGVDVLAVESADQDIHWWRQADGDGGAFVEHTITLSSNGVTVATPGDVDRDGDLDVLSLAPARNQFGLWINDGRGNFKNQPPRAFTEAFAYMDAADITGDGYVDFVAVEGAGQGRVTWWENPGAGPIPGGTPQLSQFTRHTVIGLSKVTRVDLAHLDGDAWVDIVAVTGRDGANEITWWRHDVQGAGRDQEHTFTRRERIGLQQKLMDITVADADGDGQDDVLVLTMNGDGDGAVSRVLAYRHQGAGRFDDTPATVQDSSRMRANAGMWTSLDKGDVNADGATDFLAAEPVRNGKLCWYENPNDAAPTPAPSPSSTATPTESPTTAPPAPSPTPPPASPTAMPTESPTATSPPPSPTNTPTPDVFRTATALAMTLTALAPSATATPSPSTTRTPAPTATASRTTAPTPTATPTDPPAPSTTPARSYNFLPWVLREHALPDN